MQLPCPHTTASRLPFIFRILGGAPPFPRATGASIELLSYMVVTPLFYQRLMLHDEPGAAPLRLILACLTLHDTPLAAPPFARSADKASSASASKLVAVQPPYCTSEQAWRCFQQQHERMKRQACRNCCWCVAAHMH